MSIRKFSETGRKTHYVPDEGFIPVIGDFADLFLGLFYVVRKARQAEYVPSIKLLTTYKITDALHDHSIPFWLTRKMIINQIVSESVGLVPFVGDLFIAWWKVNSRNSWLLEDFLIDRAMKNQAEEVVDAPEEVVERNEEEEVES